MLYFSRGSVSDSISDSELSSALHEALSRLGRPKRVLAIPPDMTRFHSRAGRITEMAWQYYKDALVDVLPALGTHAPLTEAERVTMFGATPSGLFRVHSWRTDLETLGRVPSQFVREVSEGKVDYDWPAQVNRLLVKGGHDLILSIGQVVPHEVIGMASYTKNLFVGTGGKEGINKSHYLGAVYGMERMMGRADTPVRRVLSYAAAHFGGSLPHVVHILTVVGREADGKLALKGLYIGDDDECFGRAAELSVKVNLTMMEEPITKAVVYLDPEEFKSTWLGNKAIYRTRMAIADGGELIILAPGVKCFGEDPQIDALIRKHGYVGTPRVLSLVQSDPELQGNLSAAAHLIHGSSEGRFGITYCPSGLTREEIEHANFAYADLAAMRQKYPPDKLREGWNELAGGERVYFISNPAVGLWAWRKGFEAKGA